MHCDVTERDMRNFQETWSLPVLRMGGEVSDGLGDVASLLNCLAENLWHQDCVAAGSVDHHSQQETETLLWCWTWFLGGSWRWTRLQVRTPFGVCLSWMHLADLGALQIPLDGMRETAVVIYGQIITTEILNSDRANIMKPDTVGDHGDAVCGLTLWGTKYSVFILFLDEIKISSWSLCL